LDRYRSEDPVILGLPRGGVPVAYEVAQALRAPLDVVVARKIGAPSFPEYAIGAIAEGGAVFVEPGAVAETGVSEAELGAAAEREAVELARRVRLYRGDRPFPDVRGRTAILVDDGIATGRTARAAIRAVREHRPRRLVLAAPVVAAQTVATLRGEVDELVYVEAPDDFVAVGIWYERFEQTSDEEVVSLLAQAWRPVNARGEAARSPSPSKEVEDPPPQANPERDVSIPVGAKTIQANLAIPPGAKGIVLFAHGSGSSRFSRRNRHVARALRDAGLATLLLDLLTPDEEAADEISGRLRFDIDLLAARLMEATSFVISNAPTRRLPVGLFGASTGAAAALVAAAKQPDVVAAVVSRGGRPDLAGVDVLRLVRAPTLFIVGGSDLQVLDLNRTAIEQLTGEKKLVVVPGATHLFEEPGKLDVVAELASGWFGRHLASQPKILRLDAISRA
jgi:putative phosphoribosyl transferase